DRALRAQQRRARRTAVCPGEARLQGLQPDPSVPPLIPPPQTRRAMRPPITGAAAAAVAALAFAAPAQADHTQALVFGATLLDQPQGQPWAVNLNVNATLGTTDGDLASPLRHVKFQFPAGAKVNADKFPTCAPKTFADSLKCPKASLLGTGLAKVDARPLL